MGVKLTTRTYWSRHHLQASTYQLRQAREIEEWYHEYGDLDRWSEYRGFVSGSIVLSLAFVEAAVNELYRDAIDGYDQYLGELDDTVVSRLTRVGPDLERRHASLDEKLDLALTLSDAPPLDPGKNPRQDFTLAKRLRNDVVHPTPASAQAGIEGEEEGSLSAKRYRQLNAKGFALSPFPSEGNPFYPAKCFSYGCGCWVLRSCVRLADKFFERLGIDPAYSPMLDEISIDEFDPAGIETPE